MSSRQQPAIFRLPIEAARQKAREILDQFPQAGYATVVENWRQLPDGQIEFSMTIEEVEDLVRALTAVMENLEASAAKQAAVEGHLPRGIGVERLRDPPTEWSRQFEALVKIPPVLSRVRSPWRPYHGRCRIDTMDQIGNEQDESSTKSAALPGQPG
jgi:hypothetical protein